jgi:glutamate-ammonia-ligase adenylyltransferase
MTERDFPPDLFSNPPGADRGIRALHEIFIRSGSRYTLPEFSASLMRGLKSSTDPDLALTGFLRFVGTAFGGAGLFNDILGYPAYGDLLFSLLGYSRYFADVLVREPELFRWLTSAGVLTSPVTSGGLIPEIERVLDMFRRPEKRLDALKRLHRRELLRIGAQDILGMADLPSAAAQLSALAGAVVDAALRISVDQAGEPAGERPLDRFCVIGLGKLGGNELNYSSDIDIIFVFGDPPAEGEGGASGADAYYNRLAARLVRNLSQPSSEGYLYRVDTRLRPNSGAGPLALSMESYLAHYESRGEIWERQMLIKARPVAGDAALGAEFLRNLEPFVYPRSLAEHPAASVARIKSRIEADVAGEPNIKLMAGGIRDIEFIAQTLQLISGGTTRDVREANTLRALSALHAQNLLAAEELAVLRDAYILYRTIEHRLQMMLNTQTHTIPSDGRAFEVLARRTGLSGAVELRRTLDANLAAVRKIFVQVLGAGSSGSGGGIAEVIAGALDEQSLARGVLEMGFHDGGRAARNIRLLARGGAPAGIPPSDPHAREALASVAAPLFEAIRATPDPDLTLMSLTLLATAQPLPHLLYEQLGESGFRKLVIAVCAVSPRFARELGRQPLLLELVSSGSGGLDSPGELPPPSPDAAAAFKSRNELMAGLRHLLGFTDYDSLTAEVSAIAAAVVRGSYAAARKGGKKSRPPLAVFALGKFGTGELAFDADLDLLFVAGDAGDSVRPVQEQMAARVLAGVTASPSGERMYEADVRLRPEGKSAPLVVEAASYAKYIATRASLWERQSLTRLRFVAGDGAVGGYVSSLVDAWVYGAPLPAGWGEEIVAMRRAMETRSRTRGVNFAELKLGAGGMADLEFIVQMLQLRFGGSNPELRGGRVGAILKHAWFPPEMPGDRAFLASAYAMYRRLELLMRIGLEERGSVLPSGEKLERLARLYDGSSGPALESRVKATMKRVRLEFLEIASFLGRPHTPAAEGER